MAQTTVHETESSFPLPDVFSSALTTIFATARPGIVQVNTQGRGGGTGIVWNADGRIITNAHVVGNHETNIQVLLSDGRSLEAQVLHRNRKLDLAMLKVDADGLTALPVGDSSQLRVGEWVFAIGHPWGQRWTVTAGIVSAMSEIKVSDDATALYIKSDVALAPGNSGGPLLDADGQVIGVNAMIFGGDLAVSIPSHVVGKWLAELPRRRVTLGIEIQTVDLPASVRAQLKPEQTSGVLVVGIGTERQAHHNDLLIGDVLLGVATTPTKDTASLRQALAESEERATLPLNILRGGQVVTLEIATHLVERAA